MRSTAHVIVLLITLLCSASSLLATQGPAVQLAWDASTDPSVSGYNVYYGTASRAYTNVLPVGSSTSAIVSNLNVGITYYFAATTYTSDGLESDYSAEASYAVPSTNNPPTLDALPSITLSQDTGMQQVPLTGISSGNPDKTMTLSVSAFSSNPGLVPNPEIAYSSPDTNGELSFSPMAGSFGSALVTVMVDNGGTVSNTVIRSFNVTVNPVVNPPTIDLLSDMTISENAGPQTRNLTGISSGSIRGTADITISAISGNPSLIPNPTISYSSPSSTGTLSFSPVVNVFGTARITVTVRDSQPTNNSSSMSFNVAINQSAPTAGLLTNAIVAPNTTFRFLVDPPVINGDKFKLSLANGAPAGAKLGTSHKGDNWLTWTPTTAQASTTNLIGINITDMSNSDLSTNEMLQVIVLDYAELTVGSVSLQAGQSGSVPLTASSSEGVTNISFTVAWPTNYLPNPTLTTSATGIASASIRPQGNTMLVTVQMSPGQTLQGSNVIGSLNFQSVAGESSRYVNLPVSNLRAVKPNAQTYTTLIPDSGQVKIINNLAMLEARTAAPVRNLTILGKVGNSYQVQYCTNFGPAAVWMPLGTYSQTNLSQTITVDPNIPRAFYRVQQK